MEGARRKTDGLPGPNGRSAGTTQSKRGWREIAVRVKDRIGEDNVSIISGGTAFFLLLGLIPGLAALIAIYGLVANPSDIQAQFANLSQVMPAEARTILEGQMTQIAEQDKAAGFAAIISILLALWGGAAAMKTVMNALNIIYREQETRGYVKLTLAALGLTLALVIIGALAIGVIVALPPLLGHLGLGEAGRLTVSILRWPFLFGVALIGLAILYRYAPDREALAWRWISPGALVATVLWVAGSALFAVYAQNFGNYNKTYGSLGAVVVLMMWLYISAFAILLGAEVNSESEEEASEQPGKSAAAQDRRSQYTQERTTGEK